MDVTTLTRKAIQLPIRVAENFLDNSKGLDVISFLVKYFRELSRLRLPLDTLQSHCRFKFKSFITLLKCAKGR